MTVHPIIFKELLKRGHSKKNGNKVWDLSDSKLWYLTPELSEGFLNLVNYEPYRKNVVDREIKLIQDNFGKIVGMLESESINVVDLGCGNGSKAEIVIKNMPASKKLRYCPVDISQHFISKASSRIRNLGLRNIGENRSFISDFENVEDVIGLVRSSDYSDHLILLLGETLSHYDLHDLLFKISEGMFDNDVLLIGNGIRHDGERLVELDKYKHPLFNEWFIHVVRALGFNYDDVEYDVRFANDRVEGFYKIKVDKEINFGGKNILFSKGDEIVVAIQYKYFEEELKKYCKMYFCSVEMIKDPQGYCLILCKK